MIVRFQEKSWAVPRWQWGWILSDFQETLEPRLQVQKHIVLQQSSIAGSWVFLLSCLNWQTSFWDDWIRIWQRTKKKKHTKVCLYQQALCCAVGLNCVLWVSARRLETSVLCIPQGGRWQEAVNFSSFIHFFCSTVFDVLFSIYLQLYWQCKCTSCDSDAGDPSAEAFVSSVKKERWTLEPFACRGTSVKQWSCWWWQYCGLTTKKRKKRINNNVDNVLVSQLLIKATYFLYRFNYLFCHIELINLRLLLSLLLEMQRERKS